MSHPTAARAAERLGRRAGSAAALFVLALALGACGFQDDRPMALAAPPPPTRLAQAAPPAPVRVVRRRAEPAEDAGDPTGTGGAATPSPREIFDFHPAGARADAWRQPFVIDPNDGPLAADVRRSAAELKAFMAMPKADPKADPRLAARHRCGETDVATAAPGCKGEAAAAPAH